MSEWHIPFRSAEATLASPFLSLCIYLQLFVRTLDWNSDMKLAHRLLVGLSALLLLSLYVLPLWEISLEAPQYPEGLGLSIHLNTVVGQKEQDLESINNLNHYIGMKRIEPDSIPELQYMPNIVAVLIALGLLVAALGKRSLLLGWILLFVILGVVGMVDFYNWEYDYGHNLNPHAAINIPDMTYQPPLIGGKQLLNFHALSLPGTGGMLMGLSILLAAFVWWKSAPRNNVATVSTPGPSLTPKALVILLLPLALSLYACSDRPEAIGFGKDECASCKMMISDQRFGAEIVTKKSKVYKFDAIECMVGFVLDKKIDESDIATEWVIDYSQPTTLIPARKAWYLHSENLPSPMGMDLSAYSSKTAYESSQASKQGELLYFDGVRLLVAKSW